MSDSLISVIIPCYNVGQQIVSTINSVLIQTYQNIEIVAVDDGSTDSTDSILDELEATCPQLHVVHQKNSGVTSARLAGIENAHGDYIAFVDADDLIDADMYERLITNIRQYKAEISHCGYRLVHDVATQYYYNTDVLIVQDRQKGVFDLLEGKIVEPSLCNKLFSSRLTKQLLEERKMDCSLRNNEDLLMNYYLFSIAKKSVYEDFCPYQYMVREESASKGQMNVHKLYDPVIASKRIYDDLQNDATLHSVALKLYLTKMLRAATYYGDFVDVDILSARRKAQKELCQILPVILRDRQLPWKNKILSLFASCFPRLYWVVHHTYLKIK